MLASHAQIRSNCRKQNGGAGCLCGACCLRSRISMSDCSEGEHADLHDHTFSRGKLMAEVASFVSFTGNIVISMNRVKRRIW